MIIGIQGLSWMNCKIVVIRKGGQLKDNKKRHLKRQEI